MQIYQYLKNISGLIHIGAHYGEEKDIYNQFDLNVLWVEADPECYTILNQQLINYTKQKCFNELITDKDDEEYFFYVASNEGASSSILDLNLHKNIWPEINYIKQISLKSKTFSTFVKNYSIDIKNYQGLIIDTQGSELLVLKSFGDLLSNINFIQVEAANFESYKNCATDVSIIQYLRSFNFILDYKDIVTKQNELEYYELYFIKS